MKWKRVLAGIAVIIGVVAAFGGIFVWTQTSRFDASLDKVYDVPIPNVQHTADPAVVERGKHLVNSIGGCATRLCHGADLGGGEPIPMGPVATIAAPNISPANLGGAYSDGELARLIRHGIKKDGRSLRFMPVQDFDWLPDSDVLAVVSYLRTAPPVDRPNKAMVIGTLGKVLDRQDQVVFDVARRIDHSKQEIAPPPAPTAEYGTYVARLCVGCHGEHLSGGKIPGAPSDLPIPLNLTPDASGLKDWTFEDFDALMRKGVRKNGKQLNPFMPVDAWTNFDDVEMHALWAHLRELPPLPFGQR